MSSEVNEQLSIEETFPKAVSKQHFHFLDSLRGLAAFWVVLYHTKPSIDPLKEVLPAWLFIPIFSKGNLGVPIFFVLSGFVIAYSLRKAEFGFLGFRNFILRRIVRLNPPYYASIAFVVLIAFFGTLVKGDPLFIPSALNVFGHLLYVQKILGFEHISEVYWTLCVEMQFYVFIYLFLWFSENRISSLNQKKFLNITILLVSIIAFIFSIDRFNGGERPITFLPYLSAFFAGILVYWCWAKKINKYVLMAYLMIAMGFAIAASDMFSLMLALSAFFIYVAAITNNLGNWLNYPINLFSGKISYSLYLTHSPVLTAAFFFGYKIFGESPFGSTLSLALGVVSCTLVAFSFWWLIERPATSWSSALKRT
ncbi:MAG: acyltransferase [Cyanobacteria bacterium P01_A01_bin.123]